MRPARRLVIVAVLFALLPAGCGGDAEDDLRVRVAALSVDGSIPSGLKAVHMAPDGAILGVYEMVPAEGSDAGEFRVPGAPEGSYRIDGPPGWWMLQARTTYPELRRGVTPLDLRMGREHSLYVSSGSAGIRPGLTWGAERLLPDGTRQTVPVETALDERGYVVVLRFREEDWQDELEVIGHLELGPPGAADPNGPPGPLTDRIRITPPVDGHPVLRRARQAPQSRLDVVLVPASDAVDIDGLRVTTEQMGLPIEVTHEAFLAKGVAHFPSISVVSSMLRVTIPRTGQAFDYDDDSWKQNANLRLLVLGDLPARDVRTPLPADADVDLVLLRPKGAVAFGRIGFEREDGTPSRVRFRAPPGPFVALLRAGSRWAEVEGAGDADVELPTPAFAEQITVEGRVDGPFAGAVVRFFRLVGEEAVLGEGFTCRVSPTATYAGRLPPGMYLVETASPRGELRMERPIDAREPGTNIHLPLTAP